MNELKLSITLLIVYVITVLGIANIEKFQEGILDFTPLFFIVVAVAVFSELILISALLRAGVKLQYYAAPAFWVLVYVVLWVLGVGESTSIQVHLVQILLILLSSILAYDVGRRIGELDKTLEGLSSNAYPNRAREIDASRDLIAAEITRSRRYHHPLSVLTIRLGKPQSRDGWKDLESIADDMFQRFVVAKASQILSDLTRTTDTILLDRDGQFIVLCPESNFKDTTILAERLETAMEDKLKTKINWGSAAFPDEAISFEDLMETAKKRLEHNNSNKITAVS